MVMSVCESLIGSQAGTELSVCDRCGYPLIYGHTLHRHASAASATEMVAP